MAKKRRELPDLRPKVYSYPEKPDEKGRSRSPPSDDALTDLATRHRFPTSFDLPKRLEDPWFWWRADKHAGPKTTAKVRREFLCELSQRAEQLIESLSKLGIEERCLIFDVIPAEELWLDEIKADVEKLARAARIAETNVKPSKRGARGDPYTINLLCRLWRVYLDAFGPDAPKISRLGTEYSGPFFEFARDVLRLFGARNVSNASLGKMIEKAQDAVAKRDTKQSIP